MPSRTKNCGGGHSSSTRYPSRAEERVERVRLRVQSAGLPRERQGDSMETTFIDYEVEGLIATITLNRPEAANAQTLPMLDDLDQAWRRAAEDDEVRVIILQGNGKHFSAGHDIKAVGDEGEDSPTWTLAGIYGIEARQFLANSMPWRHGPHPPTGA